MKKALCTVLKVLSAVVLLTAAVVFISELSPIYRFTAAKPFTGPDIFDPYAGINESYGWKRANFHTHTRVKGPLNECPEWPGKVLEDYRRLGYDILTFSNHNTLTSHPEDTALQVNVYEHGINFFKYHKLVYNPSKMILWDPLLPLLASQRQWEMDYLRENADFIALNHPDRTNCTTRSIMEKISGYRLIEADAGRSTELLHWDEALSAGHYSFCYTNDDCHDSGNHSRIAIRCSFLNSPSASYADIRETLLAGRFYSMRIPDFGDGNWEIKYSENAKLPEIESIGASNDTIHIRLSEKASLVEAIGQNHSVCSSMEDTAYLEYVMKPEDSYVRFAVTFENGVHIYSNAFARYDRSIGESPWKVGDHPVDIPLTILFNIAVLALAALCVTLVIRCLRPRVQPRCEDFQR